MSLDAMRWAMVQRPTKSVYKFVLVAMADRAGENHCCFPSIKRLSLDTMQDRKTVIAGLKCLVKLGLIRDTGKRKGHTGKVKIYQLMGVPDRHAPPVMMPDKKQPESRSEGNEPEVGSVRKEPPVQPVSRAFAASQKANDAVDGIITESEDKTAVNQPLDGIIKPVQSALMRNDPVSGMIPSDPPNDTMSGTLNDPLHGTQNLSVEPINESISLQHAHANPENQKKQRIETPGNLNLQSELLSFEEPQKTKKTKALKSGIEKYRGIELSDLPDGLSAESARNFIDHRKAIKKPLTQHGFALYLKALLSCAGCGLTLDQVVDETIDAGWQSIKLDWLNNRLKPPTRFSGYGDQVDDNRPRKELRA